MIEADGKQMTDHGKALPLPGTIAVIGVIDTAQVDELLEPKVRRIPQCLAGRKIIGSLDLDRDLAQTLRQPHQAIAQSLPDLFH